MYFNSISTQWIDHVLISRRKCSGPFAMHWSLLLPYLLFAYLSGVVSLNQVDCKVEHCLHCYVQNTSHCQRCVPGYVLTGSHQCNTTAPSNRDKDQSDDGDVISAPIIVWLLLGVVLPSICALVHCCREYAEGGYRERRNQTQQVIGADQPPQIPWIHSSNHQGESEMESPFLEPNDWSETRRQETAFVVSPDGELQVGIEK